MTHWRWAAISVLLGFMVVFTCAGVAAPVVVTTVRPLYSLIAGVMAGVGTPHLLIKGAQSPHTYALQPSDALLLKKADLIVWIGPSLETFLVKSLKQAPSKTELMALIEAPSLRLYSPRYTASDSHTHAPSSLSSPLDPHIWLDAKNAQLIAQRVANRLISLDPANASTYKTNAARLTQRLEALDERLKERLRSVGQQLYLSFHDSYQYFDQRYGLRSVGCIVAHPENLARPQHLASLLHQLKTENIRCIFVEKEFPARLAKTLADRSGVRLGVLDPLGAAIEPVDEDLYFTLMENLAKSFIACLQPSRS